MGKRLGTGQILFGSVQEGMNQTTQITATRLTYSGILPFLFFGIAKVMKFTGADYGFALCGYGTMIATFLCGIHWAVHLFFPDRCRRNLLIISNLVTLLGYATLFVPQQDIALLIQSLCFAFLLWIDYEALMQGIIPRWYFELRRNATMAVILVLVSVVSLS